MDLRRSILSGTWYPGRKKEVQEFLDACEQDTEDGRYYYAAVVPHAGWVYSGKTAASAVRRLCLGKELIIVIGGHLPAGYPVIGAFEEYIEVPEGKVKNRIDLIKKLSEKIEIQEDNQRDNTVEVVIPIAANFAENADFIWLRAPSDTKSLQLAEELYKLCSDEKIKAGVIGSTDLTHYGPNYSFSPHGTGLEALKWVKETNDAEIIQHMVDMEPELVIEHAAEKRSACSAGAAAAAVQFGRLNNVNRGILTDYSTSYDLSPAESFVGYAGIIF